MSSSMETNLLLSDVQPGPKTYKDIDYQKWLEKAHTCPAKQRKTGLCTAIEWPCEYKTCFGRYWGTP